MLDIDDASESSVLAVDEDEVDDWWVGGWGGGDPGTEFNPDFSFGSSSTVSNPPEADAARSIPVELVKEDDMLEGEESILDLLVDDARRGEEDEPPSSGSCLVEDPPLEV